jgi:hypothetical protein
LPGAYGGNLILAPTGNLKFQRGLKVS